MDTVLITGAAGFIGSHCAEAWLARGARVVGLDNLDPFYAEGVKKRNLEEIGRHPQGGNFAFVRADIRNAGEVDRVFDEHRPTVVLHLAARAGVRPSIEQPALYMAVNVEGTTNLLERARKGNVKRFLLASSSSVYGNNSKVPFAEDDDVSGPISPYAASKRACELIAHAYHHLYRMPIACLRFFTVYGPRQRPDLAIMKFMRLIREGKTIPMFGDGSMSRDFTYIDDIVAGVAASDDVIERHGFRTWNLGGDHPVTLREMIEVIGRVAGATPKIERLAQQAGDVERTYADLTRSRAELGFSPRTSFEEGVRRQWEWAEGV